MTGVTRERPILFNGSMVRAILAGRKVATRRIVRKQPPAKPSLLDWSFHGQRIGPCPYGQPNDRLWVRETFCIENTSEYHGDHTDPADGRPIEKHADPDGTFWRIPHYRATEPEPHIVPFDRENEDDDSTAWSPAIHMPRAFSRICLEVRDVNVHRLQDITDDGARGEGMTQLPGGLWHWEPLSHHGAGETPRAAFGYLWETIHGAGSWNENPLVWAVDFRLISPPR